MAFVWSFPQFCVLGILFCLFHHIGACTIHKETELEDLKRTVKDPLSQIQAPNITTQKGKKHKT